MRFLSQEHCSAATAAFAADAELAREARGVNLVIVYYVSDSPEGDFSYHLKFADGTVVMARGELPQRDAEVRSSYDTAARLARGEIANQMAVMLGKVRLKGAMMTLLRHQAMLNRVQAVSAALDLSY
jgi:putative sterol carrier protein